MGKVHKNATVLLSVIDYRCDTPGLDLHTQKRILDWKEIKILFFSSKIFMKMDEFSEKLRREGDGV